MVEYPKNASGAEMSVGEKLQWLDAQTHDLALQLATGKLTVDGFTAAQREYAAMRDALIRQQSKSARPTGGPVVVSLIDSGRIGIHGSDLGINAANRLWLTAPQWFALLSNLSTICDAIERIAPTDSASVRVEERESKRGGKTESYSAVLADGPQGPVLVGYVNKTTTSAAQAIEGYVTDYRDARAVVAGIKTLDARRGVRAAAAKAQS